MDKKSTNIHEAIKNFILELSKSFPTDKKIALYNRLLQSPPSEIGTSGISKHITSFDTFLETYGEAIIDKLEIPNNAFIKFNKSERISIDMTKVLNKSDEETKKIIRMHLLAIRTMINPSKEELEKMENAMNVRSTGSACEKEGEFTFLDRGDNSKEGKFISGIFNDMESTFKGVKIDDPAMAIGTLLNSGIVQKLLGTLQNGDLDLGKLMGTMQKAMGSLI